MNTNNAQNAQNPQNDDNDSSLSMFFAAIGGAVLGMLATLIVLAVINGGTLNFTGTAYDSDQQIIAVVDRLVENVGAVSTNLDTLSSITARQQERITFLEEQNASRIDWDIIQQRQIDVLTGFCGEPCQ